MFIDIPRDTRAIQQELYEACASRSQYEINFIMSHNDKIACFKGNRFYITDLSFKPELIYESTALANACIISDSGKYALFQTAHNAENDENSGAFAIISVQAKVVINKGRIETGWKGITGLFLDEVNRCFWVYYNNETEVKFGFDFVADERTLKAHFDNATSISGYELMRRAETIVKQLKEGVYSRFAAKDAQSYLKRAATDSRTSTHQLALAYKALGEMYECHGYKDKALQAYEEGLRFNNTLPVKRTINRIEKEMAAKGGLESKSLGEKDVLGLSLEERRRLQAEIIAEDDGEWMKELDARNRAKSGIAEKVACYELTAQANEIIARLKAGDYSQEDERAATGKLKIAASNKHMSTNQLSQAYRALGEMYEHHSYKEKAIQAYREGLRLNPALAVKRALKRLEKEIESAP